MQSKKTADIPKPKTKSNHAAILTALLNTVDHQIPEWNTLCLEQSLQSQKQILQDLRALMKLQKQKDTGGPLILDNSSESNSQQIKLFRRVKSSLLYTEYARLKRFMLIYIAERLNLVRDHYWAYGGYIMESEKPKLAEHQNEYLEGYQKLLKKFCRKRGVDVLSCFEPPVKYNVEVTVNQNHEDILTEKGEVIKISKGSILYLPLNLLENLILRKVLVQTR